MLLLDYVSCQNEDERAKLMKEYEDNVASERERKQQEAKAARSKQCKAKHTSGIIHGLSDEAKKRKTDGEAAGRAKANKDRAEKAALEVTTCVKYKGEKPRRDKETNTELFSEWEWKRNRPKHKAVCEACKYFKKTIECTVCHDRKPRNEYKQYHRKQQHLAICPSCQQ